MARPTQITDEQILHAAREVFLEKGIQATSAEVAKRAGVAEGSIFKRFKTKHTLFSAAMHLDGELEWIRTLTARLGKGEVKQNLIDIGLQIVEFFRRLMPLIMMSWANPGPNGLPESLSTPNPPPLRAIKAIAGFFEAEIRAGRIKRHDPEILARAYLGGLQNYVFFELLMKAHAELPLPPEMYLRGMVNLLWNGCAPEPGKKKK
jgi:AcrR family transcriptional regulator